MAKSALVTGGAGFIGSHLVDRLLADGWHVDVVDNFDAFYDPSLKRRNIAAHRLHPSYSIIRADIRSMSALRERLRDSYDVIVHFAAKAGARPSIQHPVAYQEVNVRGTQVMLEIVRERQVPQFVFASSSSVYGISPDVPSREDDNVLLPVSPYAATKVSSELLGRVYSRFFGLRFVALRLFTVYGPRQRPDMAVHKFARRMLDGGRVPVFGNGTTSRDYTYVDDVVSGIVAAMTYDGSAYEVINLGSSRSVSLLEMIRTLEHALGTKADLAFLDEQLGDVPQSWADLNKARDLLGYAPATEFADGVKRFADWLQSMYFAAAFPSARWLRQDPAQPVHPVA
ncbi:MAG TPA: NAD-dependent epimerase/dehydratase family protein [Gemmatimonadaceae bacterium]|nr:NAD-dependent epimerase/dehydratase family protein [Gemmatimonadaceae bacterium]